MKRRVVVAMSGGVDSSVAAYLLKEQGYEVIGLFMSLGTCLEKLAPKRKACCSIFDAQDAAKVADLLAIKFSVLDFKPEFEKLIQYFCSEYDKGRTPNPCIRCNQFLKFGKLLEYADKLGADYIATGHYARVLRQENNTPLNPLLLEGTSPKGRYLLRKGIDQTKDQSYVLFALNQKQLSRIIFPLGEMNKTEVRKIAHKLDLPVKDKLDSQEICFVPGNDYRVVLKQRMPERLKEGFVTDMQGKIIGRHDGYQLFTIGQRHGLKIALGKPAYVAQIVPETNTVVLGFKDDVYQTKFIVDEVNWIVNIEAMKSPAPAKAGSGRLEVEAKIRYLNKQSKAKLSFLDNDEVEVEFQQAQLAITPGQAAVFYNGDDVLGGGWIKQVVSS